MRARRGPAAVFALLWASAACSPGEPPPAPPAAECEPLVRSEPPQARSLVFILSDTTRRDRLGIYGGPARTPHFDAFAAGGVLFTGATTQAPWTKPSIATLFTGLLPAAHGVVSHPEMRQGAERQRTLESDVLGAGHVTLAESLAAAGYQTAAFVSNPWLQSRLGFAQGFETWEERFANNATPGEQVTAAGLAWLREREGEERPFFLYLHYMDAHAPYHRVPEEALAARRAAVEADDRSLSRESQRAIARIARDARNRPLVERGLPPNLALFELAYDMGVEHFDRALGAFLRGFEGLEASRGAAVVVTSDHGEALFEHGWQSHGHGLYEDETGIPLAVHLPGVATTGRVGCPVGLIDLRRTLCEYLGVPCEGEGVSFFSEAIADPQRLVWTESVIARPRNRAVRTARYKLLYEPDGRVVAPARPEPFELYDLSRDPGEQRDLLDAGRAEADAHLAFQRLSAEAERSAAGPRATAERTVLDEETRQRLEALGYLDPDE